MSKFDFLGFGYDAGPDEMFVAHAGKYSAEETIALCKSEYSQKFYGVEGRNYDRLREPTIADVQDAHCAFRFGVSPEWPDGCYALVGPAENGAFPVHVIDFGKLA